MIDKLACPSCHKKYEVFENIYLCRKCDTKYVQSNGLLNFLPVLQNENGLDKLILENTGYEILAAASSGDLRRADNLIQKIIKPLESQHESQQELAVKNIIGPFEYFYEKHSKHLSENAKANFTTIYNLLRYELECIAGKYDSSFVLPDKIIDNLPRGDYLEVCIGPGNNIKRIMDSGKAHTVTGCDISKRMVERASRFFDNGHSLFFRADANRLPLLDESFDVAIMLNTLDRIPDIRVALRELYRVLRQEGSLVIGNCQPLQYEKFLDNGLRLTYVPKKNRIRNVCEAVEISGCQLKEEIKSVPWHIETVIDNSEDLEVDVVVGIKNGTAKTNRI